MAKKAKKAKTAKVGLRKRKIKTRSMLDSQRIRSTQYLVCDSCNFEEIEVPGDVGRVTCPRCVQRQVAPPEIKVAQKTAATGFPRGWALKKFYEVNGEVYSKGKLLTDAKKIAALRKEFGVTQTVTKVKTGKVTKPRKTKVVAKTKRVTKSRKPKTKITKSRGRKNDRVAG